SAGFVGAGPGVRLRTRPRRAHVPPALGKRNGLPHLGRPFGPAGRRDQRAVRLAAGEPPPPREVVAPETGLVVGVGHEEERGGAPVARCVATVAVAVEVVRPRMAEALALDADLAALLRRRPRVARDDVVED